MRRANRETPDYHHIRADVHLADNVREWIELGYDAPPAPHVDSTAAEMFFSAAALVVGNLDPEDGQSLDAYVRLRRECFPAPSVFSLAHPLSIQSYRVWYEKQRGQP